MASTTAMPTEKAVYAAIMAATSDIDTMTNDRIEALTKRARHAEHRRGLRRQRRRSGKC